MLIGDELTAAMNTSMPSALASSLLAISFSQGFVWLADAAIPLPASPEAGLLQYLLSQTTGTIGISAVLGFAVWYLVRQIEKMTLRWDEKEKQLKIEQVAELKEVLAVSEKERERLESRCNRYEEIIFNRFKEAVNKTLPPST